MSIVGSCDGAAIFKRSVSAIASASQNTVAITLQADATMRNYLGSGGEAYFQAILCTLLSGLKL